MIEIEKVIENPEGLHARPAMRLANTAKKFQADINVTDTVTGQVGNAKSMLSIMSLGITKGHRIKIRVSGSDEEEAGKALSSLAENDFA